MIYNFIFSESDLNDLVFIPLKKSDKRKKKNK